MLGRPLGLHNPIVFFSQALNFASAAAKLTSTRQKKWLKNDEFIYNNFAPFKFNPKRATMGECIKSFFESSSQRYGFTLPQFQRLLCFSLSVRTYH